MGRLPLGASPFLSETSLIRHKSCMDLSGIEALVLSRIHSGASPGRRPLCVHAPDCLLP